MCGNVECNEGCHIKVVEFLGRRRHARDVVYGKRHCCVSMSNWTRHCFASLFGRMKSDTTLDKDVVCDVQGLISCRVRYVVVCSVMSSVTCYRVQLGVDCELVSYEN